MLNFELERKGFPVTIGGVEFFFGTTMEELREFYDKQEEYEIKRKELELETANLPDDETDIEVTDQRIRLLEKIVSLDYDTLLGEGSFAKIYEKNKDLEQLQSLFDVISDAIEHKLNSLAAEQQKKNDEKISKMLEKKNKKRK